MEWFMATKVATLFLDKKTRNIIIISSLCLILSLFSFILLPTLLLTLPTMAFTNESEANNLTNEYTNILVEYKKKIHEDIKVAHNEYKSQGKSIKNTEINYPSLSLIIAYDNVINKNRYQQEKTHNLNVSKEQIFKFLDNSMSYVLEGETLVSTVKSPEEIANFFNEKEEKQMFLAIYETMKRTDLDNKVPDVPFSDFDYLEGGIELPYLSQRDERWANAPYGIETIAQAGCGITSMAMVINGLIPEANVLPPELALWSYKNGHYVDNVGTAWSLFGALAKEYNLQMRNLSRNNPQDILDELSKGHPVVMSLDPGTFINGYHIIVLRGISSSGKILVSDPWSIENSKKEWDFSLLLAESSSLSPSCFWAFSR